MTNNSNNKSGTSNQQQQQQSIDFMNEKWELEEKCFTDTLMPPIKIQDRETKRSRWVRKHFPRIKPIEQRGLNHFIPR